MFISKKKFHEAIEIAKKETEEKIYQRERTHEFERTTINEIERIRCDFEKHNFEVDERLERLEKAVFKKKRTPFNRG